jgi:L-threonylcarbamoyladenylate synthase
VTARVVADGPSSRREAAAILEAGGVIGLPTDTVYGIAVAGSTPGGAERLFEIKRRPPDKGIVLLIDNLSQVDGLVRHTRPADVLQGLWPGGLTLVLPAADGGTIAVRVPDHPAPREIARQAGPLPTTSANVSGLPDARSAGEVAAALGDRLDLILDGGRSPGGVPSTVVDCTGDIARILRAGAVPDDALAGRLREAGLPAPALVSQSSVGR